MNIEDIIKEIRDEILKELKDKYGSERAAIQKDVEAFIKDSKEKIIRWTLLLEQEQITKEEFELLMYSQKDLFVMKTLYKAGVSSISLGHFKNKAISIAVVKVLEAISSALTEAAADNPVAPEV